MAFSANLSPQFGVFGDLEWDATGSRISDVSLSLIGDALISVSGVKAFAQPLITSWITDSAFIVDSSEDSKITFSGEFMGSSSPIVPTDTTYIVNNIAIVTGGGGGGGSVSIYDEGGLVTTNATEIDFIGTSVAAALQGASRVNITHTESNNIDGGAPNSVYAAAQNFDGGTP